MYMTDGLFGGYQIDLKAVALLQGVAAVVQALAAVIIIFVTKRAARAGAERAYELGQRQALAQEERALEKQQKELEKQAGSVRLLLGLEIGQNLKDLSWLRDNLVEILGEDDERRYQGGSALDEEDYRWLDARRRFISSHLPDWGHRFWHGQQSSYLLPVALDELEIRKVNYLHSELERLTKIKDMWNERAQQHEESAFLPPEALREDAPRLWAEFTDILNRLLETGSPLADTAEESGARRLAGDMKRLGASPRARQSEPRPTDASQQP
jgi:hypothetical protein